MNPKLVQQVQEFTSNVDPPPDAQLGSEIKGILKIKQSVAMEIDIKHTEEAFNKL